MNDPFSKSEPAPSHIARPMPWLVQLAKEGQPHADARRVASIIAASHHPNAGTAEEPWLEWLGTTPLPPPMEETAVAACLDRWSTEREAIHTDAVRSSVRPMVFRRVLATVSLLAASVLLVFMLWPASPNHVSTRPRSQGEAVVHVNPGPEVDSRSPVPATSVTDHALPMAQIRPIPLGNIVSNIERLVSLMMDLPNRFPSSLRELAAEKMGELIPQEMKKVKRRTVAPPASVEHSPRSPS